YELQQKSGCGFAHDTAALQGVFEAERMLTEEGNDGRYLVRESLRHRGQMTLSLRFNNITKNFRLFYDGKHFVGDKRFDTIHDLVADGLITLYLELHAKDYIADLGANTKYEESPYMTLYRNNRNQNKTSNHHKAHQRGMKSGEGMQLKRLSNYEDCDMDNDSSYGTDSTSGIDVQQFEKMHNFKTHNFMGSPWCDFCGNFIWGIIGQGVKCEDCGFGAHRRCSEKVPNDCSPDLRHIRRIFGVELTTFVKASNNVRPFVVDLCVKEVERRGLNAEGLYRVSGSADEIEALKCRFESDWEQTELYFKAFEDIHVITGVLKLYFRSLPIPLITFDSYPKFISAINANSEGILSWNSFQTLAERFAKIQRRGKLEKEVVDRWKAIFEKWWNELTSYADENKDTLIEFDEWLKFFESLGKNTKTHQELPEFLKTYLHLFFLCSDYNKDGLFCLKDYKKYLTSQTMDTSKADEHFKYMLIEEDVANGNAMTSDRFKDLVYDFWVSTDPDSKGKYMFGPFDQSIDVLEQKIKKKD
ncbi:unnamed protein product, partial [Oppiella nova]